MGEYHGFLFSKLHLIGTKSEGPTYLLQQFDYSEIPIVKQAELWKEDPILQKHLGSKVNIGGKLASGWLFHESVTPYSKPLGIKEEVSLEIDLRLASEELWLNKKPPSPLPRPFQLVLRVRRPHRSVWKGLCPTTQIYDFFVEREQDHMAKERR
jgi:hypothetical protein